MFIMVCNFTWSTTQSELTNLDDFELRNHVKGQLLPLEILRDPKKI